ncbi:MAG: hypothetical protein KAI85_12530, partial [Halopseudomonas aestusnigri]|nr:hypothetical protein [Halopseudomonas aestusnigri]
PDFSMPSITSGYLLRDVRCKWRAFYAPPETPSTPQADIFSGFFAAHSRLATTRIDHARQPAQLTPARPNREKRLVRPISVGHDAKVTLICSEIRSVSTPVIVKAPT